jgi:hypothetical protein
MTYDEAQRPLSLWNLGEKWSILLATSGSTILTISGDLVKTLLIRRLGVCACFLGCTTSALIDDVAGINGVLLIPFCRWSVMSQDQHRRIGTHRIACQSPRRCHTLRSRSVSRPSELEWLTVRCGSDSRYRQRRW